MSKPARPYIVVSRPPRVRRVNGRLFVNGVEYVRPGQSLPHARAIIASGERHPSAQVHGVSEANLHARGQ